MILVTGGAGYIGSHAARYLLDKGFKVLVLDNLSTGHLKSIDKRATFIFGDIGDNKLLDYIFTHFKISGVMHFAANCLVGESVVKPIKYYQNNVGKTLNLLGSMLDHKVTKFIFSSSCATYGIPKWTPISEDFDTNPINPYGQSKLMVEKILRDLSNVNRLDFISLRYFNAAGADFSGEIGEDHNPESHLIPNVLLQMLGKNSDIEVYGNDYETPDGTCIRDYIHVTDLAAAHILALEFLLQHDNISEIYNLGTEKGYSVMEIIHKCKKVTGKQPAIKFLPRRAGDPPELIASSVKIKKDLGWKANLGIEEIIQTAWNWYHKGYQQ
ncbi:UDP-glucose 4-epimerase GalE [Peribacillus deserti]|uniref:UDP-glucose 4-epimerase n=1 Tax=Peribacillus deserti TaxID=673318 RepID=A0A2N5M0B2_9BACI|nr:UDP-glucose 4-epimerase GalE [Peribacillus deserti]PLT27799.1 UDP-glucose 4-epimerase GalE [Peribacillus deserti]